MNAFGPAALPVKEQAGGIEARTSPAFPSLRAGVTAQASVELARAAPVGPDRPRVEE